MTTFLLNTIRASTYLILLTPLVIAPWFVYPFIAPKAVFFWIFAEIIFALWVLLAIRDKKYRPRENILLYAALAFVLLMVLASFRGINPLLSFFSTFERMSGVITLIHGFLIFLALSSTFKKTREWKRFLRMAVFVGVVVGAIFFLDDSVARFLPEARKGSTIGNSSFFGAYIIFPIFFAIYLFLSDMGWRRMFAFVSFLIMAFALYFSGATGAFYSGLLGVFLIFAAGIYFAPFKTRGIRRHSERSPAGRSDGVPPKLQAKGEESPEMTQNVPSPSLRAERSNDGVTPGLPRHPTAVGFLAMTDIKPYTRRVAILLITSVVLLSFLAAYGTLSQNETILNFLPSKFSQEKIGARLVVWENAWQAVKERPVLGWGPENFQVAFAKYFDPCMPLPKECGGEIWFDKAHNIVMDTLVASGFAGLLAYLSIFASAVYLVWKRAIHGTPSIKHESNQPSKMFHVSSFMFQGKWLLPSVLTALLAAYFAQNLFVFDMPTTYLMFFFVLAMVGAFGNPKAQTKFARHCEHSEAIPVYRDNAISISASAVTLIILLAGLYILPYQSLRSAHLTWQTMHTTVPNLENRVKLYSASLEATPLGTMQTRQSFTNNAILWLQQEVDFPEETLETIVSEAEKMPKENPHDLRSNLILGNFYNAMTKYYILKLKDKDTARIYLDKAKLYLEKALALSPKNQQVYLSLSQNFIFRKDYKGAERILEAAIDLEPRYGESHYNLGDLYIIEKKFKEAAEKFDTALELGYRVDTAGKAAQIAQAYYEAGQYEKSAKWYEEVIIKKPKDPDARWTLAIIYKELGELDKAKLQASVILQIDQNYKDAVEEFVSSMLK